MEINEMSKEKKSQIFLLIVIVLSINLYPALILCQTCCERAEELFQKSLRQTDLNEEKSNLKETVSLCPQHARAWNNLGTIYEKEGNWKQAEKAYRLANEHDPELGIPLAGLGDVAMNQGRYQEAIKWYQAFLAFLANEKQKGDPQGLGIYEEEYRGKYDRANLKLKILTDSMSSVVPKGTIKRGLKPIAPKGEFKERIEAERLPLFIYFDFESAELKPQGQAQLIEMAQTMLSPEHRDRVFLIEGHSDTLGSDEYNLDLSQRRAGKVRTFLASQGVISDRLRVSGVGESKPLVLTGSIDEQAINRRVEFVRLGFYGK
jgi:outer membrane protein OmpA-like peptidoglycan-associated protein